MLTRNVRRVVQCRAALNRAFSSSEEPKSFIERVMEQGSDGLVGKFVNKGGFDQCLDGLTVTSQTPGEVEGHFEVEPGLQNTYKTLHGGAIATVIDVVGTMALLTKDATKPGVSIEINSCYLNAAAAGDTVEFKGTVAKHGRKLGFADVELTSRSTGKTIAKGRHTKFFP